MPPPPDASHDANADSRAATAEALERIRAHELASLTDADALRIIRSITGTPVPRDPLSCGLVVQQALFHRRRNS